MRKLIPFLFFSAYSLVNAVPLPVRAVSCCTPLEKTQAHLSLLVLYLQQGETLLAQQALFDAQVLLSLHDPQMQSQELWEQVASAHARLQHLPQAEALYARLYALQAKSEYLLPLAELALAQQQTAKAQQWLLRADPLYSATDFPARLPYALWSAGLTERAKQRFAFLFSEAGQPLRQEASVLDLDTWRLAYAASDKTQALSQLQAIQNLDAVSQPLLADVWMSLKRYTEASAIYAQLFAQSPARLDYALAWANSLALAKAPQAATVYGDAFELAQTQENVSDAQWRNLMSGLKAHFAYGQAEQAFLRLHKPLAADWLEAAFLAELLGDEAAMLQRYQAVLDSLPAAATGPEVLQQRISAEWALFLARRRQAQTPAAFHELQETMVQRVLQWRASERFATPEGFLSIVRMMMALETPALHPILAQQWQGSPPASWTLEQQRDYRLLQAEWLVSQGERLSAALHYEALFRQWRSLKETPSEVPWSEAQLLALARGLGVVGKLQAAELLWQACLTENSTSRETWQWTFERLWAQAQAYPQWQTRAEVKARFEALPMPTNLSPAARLARAQLALTLQEDALARQDFTQVLAHWPGERLARQGLAMSLKSEQRYGLAHQVFTELQQWYAPATLSYRDATLRLAEIERAWQDPSRAVQRAQILRAEAERFLHNVQGEQGWLLTPDLRYLGTARWQQQNLFIGERAVALGISELAQRLTHPLRFEDHQPPLVSALGLDLSDYQPLGDSPWFSFSRGRLYTTSHWRQEFAEGPLHAWVTPTLAYQWGVPNPLSIGSNQHGRVQTTAGLQLDARQALLTSGQWAFGQAELYLGSFYNYGGDVGWRWREVWMPTQGMWGVDVVTGLDNYLVLDGSNQTQDLFRQRNGLRLVYQDPRLDYQGGIDIDPIYGTLNDLHLGTQHRLAYRFDSDWQGFVRAQWHRYEQPLQALQNQWRAGVGVRYDWPTPETWPLHVELGFDWVHFYQSEQGPTPQFLLQWETRL